MEEQKKRTRKEHAVRKGSVAAIAGLIFGFIKKGPRTAANAFRRIFGKKEQSVE